MTLITAKVKSFIESHQLILSSDHIAAAVSGGIDSMVMLYILHNLKHELGFVLSAIHINHGIRGVHSDLDESFVMESANKLGVDINIEKLPDLRKTATEEHLRTARYKKYEKILKERKLTKIATAHHLNDQLETFLMRLNTGASLNGLTGIPAKRSKYIRPLLQITKREIETFAREKKITFRTDHTNLEPDKLRNRIRQYIVPHIEQVFDKRFYIGFRKSINELISINSDYKSYLQDEFSNIVTVEKDAVYIELKSFNKLSITRRRHLVTYCIFSFFGLNSYFELNNYLAFESFIKTAKTGRLFYFSKQLQAEKNRESLIFYNTSSQSYQSQELLPGKDVKMGRNIISINAVSYDSLKWNEDKNMEFICGDRVQFPLQVGSWEEGEWFIPLGMEKKQKLSDFYINEKVSRYEKQRIPIVRNGDEIIWIAGYRIDNRYKVREGCKNIFRFNLNKREQLTK